MTAVNWKQEDIAVARLYQNAVEDKIFEIVKKIIRASTLPFTTSIMQKLPPELRDIIYSSLCDTSSMHADKLTQRSTFLRRLDIPMIGADTKRLHESLMCTGGTSGVTAHDTLSGWFHEDFSQQLIDFWYRKTNITVSDGQDLQRGGMMHCDRLGSQLVPARSIRHVTVSMYRGWDYEFYPIFLRLIHALDPGYSCGTTIVFNIQSMPKRLTQSDKPFNLTFADFLELLHPEIDAPVQRDYHVEFLIQGLAKRAVVDAKGSSIGGVMISWRDVVADARHPDDDWLLGSAFVNT